MFIDTLEEIKIENLIYTVRGKQVMLDSDLAMLYNCKNGTKEINQAVKNNPEKFPERFAFRISEQETIFLKSKILTSKGGSRKGHTVFTEQGVAMLSTILKSKTAIKTSIKIMDTFVLMRNYISENLIEQKFINELVLRHDNDIKLLQESFDKLSEKETNNHIYFDGQIYDAYSKIIDIISNAKKELIIIDGYSDKVILDIISRIKTNVILITKQNSRLSRLDIEKYNKQYNNLKIVYDNTFHDRYFILDKDIIYHCGTSINYLGTKTFGINKLEDNVVIKSLFNKIDNILNQQE